MRLRRFLLCLAVFCGVLFVISLAPNLQRLMGGDLPPLREVPLPAVRAAVLMPGPAPTAEDSRAEAQTLRRDPEARQEAGPHQRLVSMSSIEQEMDANGNALGEWVYRRAVYMAFALGDAMG